MGKILIIGNVLKDVYLRLDDRRNDFETDARGISWLELGFNGAEHTFFRRTSTFGGLTGYFTCSRNRGGNFEFRN